MGAVTTRLAYCYERAPYAQFWEESRGRQIEEPDAADRTPYQRDRDRILFSEAFRRLQSKRQVFLASEEGDFRTRLTHTLEVAQLTRSICRSLRLDEDLGECCALAHDIGHPPFGHAGEDALQACMVAALGPERVGFDHNVQAMRVLRVLEQVYARFDGLNMTWEVLEGVAKHNGPIASPWAEMPLFADLEPAQQSCLEAQVAAVCDELAYLHHDLDDGFQTQKLHIEDVLQVQCFKRMWDEIGVVYPDVLPARLVKETIRQMIGLAVGDVLTESRKRLEKVAPTNVAAVRQHPDMLIGISDTLAADMAELKAFLMQHLYRHTSVNRFNFQAHRMVRDLFMAFMNHRKMLPPAWRLRLPEDPADLAGKALVVCDYIGSLSDTSAMREHTRLFAPVKID